MIFILIVILLFILPNPLNKEGTVISKIKERISVTAFSKGYSVVRRIAIWKFTGMMIKDHPFLGLGLGNYKYNSLEYQARFFEQGENRSLYSYGFATRAHNEYLQFWAELGMIGFAIFIWLIICYFNYGIRYLKNEKDKQMQGIIIGLMGSVVAVLVDAMFGFPLHLPATIVLFWLVIALTVIIIKRRDGKSAIYINKKDINKKIKMEKENNKYLFKYFSYPVIILITLFLCSMIVCPFISLVYQFYGVQNFRKANYDEAIKNYHKAIKWNPYDGLTYCNIGEFLIEKGFYSLALENFEKAEKYIDHPDLPEKLAYLYLKRGKVEKAISKLIKAISYQKDEKSMVPLYVDLGKIYLQVRNHELAEVSFANALKINSEHVNARYGLAIAYLNQNKRDEGLRELEKVIELAPESQEAQYARINIQKFTESEEKKELKELIEKETN